MRGGKFDADRARALVAQAKIADDATPGPWINEDGMVTALDWLTMPEYPSDAAFIAAARDLVPALAAELEAASTAIESPREATITDEQILEAANAWFARSKDHGPTGKAADANLVADLRALFSQSAPPAQNEGGR